MIEITSVYRTLKSLANEDQSGFITPSSFNDFAKTAQMNVYNEIMGNGMLAEQTKKASIDISNGASIQNRSAARRSFFLKSQLAPLVDSYYLNLPADFSSFHSLIEGSLNEFGRGLGTRVNMMYDQEKFEMFKGSYTANGNQTEGAIIEASLTSNPVRVSCMIGGQIQINSPSLNTNYYLRYYRVPGCFYQGSQLPTTPSIGYSINEFGDVETDADSSRHFDLPPSYFSEVVNEMAKLIGVQIEETMVYQYGQAEEVQREVPKSN